MAKIPFEKLRSPVNPVEQIVHKITQGEAVSGDELLDAIEQSQGHHLEDRLRDVIRRFSVSAVKRRGRPSKSKGREDFALEEVDARYPVLLQKYEQEARRKRHLAAARGAVLGKAEPPPSESAYTEILEGMQEDFPNMDWRSLATKHSTWKRGHFHPSENDIDSEDVDAEIERVFPPPRRS